MEQPRTLAELRAAYARDEIDGETYRVIRRALVTAIVSGALPASPLQPVRTAPPLRREVDDAANALPAEPPAEHSATTIFTAPPAVEQGAPERAPRAAPAAAEPITDERPAARTGRPPWQWMAVAATAVVVILVGVVFTRGGEEPPAPVRPTAAITDTAAEARIEAIESFVAGGDWTPQTIAAAHTAYQGLTASEARSARAIAAGESLRRAVGGRIDDIVELRRIGFVDSGEITALQKLAADLGLDTSRLEAAEPSGPLVASRDDGAAADAPGDAGVAPTSTTTAISAASARGDVGTGTGTGTGTEADASRPIIAGRPVGDTAASDTTPGDTSAADTTTASDTTASDTTASDTAAADTASSDTTASDTTASDTAAGDTAAGDTAAGDTAAGDT
ncbi:MAG: hypothetical protein KDK06_18800, partial [Gammaproteobacteria bacterium]|nr:hypothetical protein [Gammaproteobacteria bacterium]